MSDLQKRVVELEQQVKDLEQLVVKTIGRSSAYNSATLSLLSLHHKPELLVPLLEQTLLALEATSDDVPSDELQNTLEQAKARLLRSAKAALGQS